MVKRKRGIRTTTKVKWMVDVDDQTWAELEKPGNEAARDYYLSFLKDHYDNGGYRNPDYPKAALKEDVRRQNAQRSDAMNNGCVYTTDIPSPPPPTEEDEDVDTLDPHDTPTPYQPYAEVPHYLDDEVYKALVAAYRETLRPSKGTRYFEPGASAKRERLAALLRLYTTELEEFNPNKD